MSQQEIKVQNGRPIVIAADNPNLDTSMYEVEYSDGYKTAMTANAISSNLFNQVEQDRQLFFIIQHHHRFVYRQHTDQGGRLFYPYIQWKQEEERDHQRMVSLHAMERWEFYLEPS